MDQQQGNRGRCHARDAAGLADGLRAMAAEFLAHLGGQALHMRKIQVLWQLQGPQEAVFVERCRHHREDIEPDERGETR